MGRPALPAGQPERRGVHRQRDLPEVRIRPELPEEADPRVSETRQERGQLILGRVQEGRGVLDDQVLGIPDRTSRSSRVAASASFPPH